MKNVYLEASFLVAFLVKGHINHKNAIYIFKRLVRSNKVILLVTTLTLDEVWWILYRESSYVSSSIHKPFSAFATEFLELIDGVLTHHQIALLESEDLAQLIKIAILGSEKYNLRPRDAFHYAYTKEWNADLASFDKDYKHTDLKILEI